MREEFQKVLEQESRELAINELQRELNALEDKVRMIKRRLEDLKNAKK